MNTTQQSLYTKFKEWLNDCPTQIEDYQDNLNHVIIRFDLPISEELWNLKMLIVTLEQVEMVRKLHALSVIILQQFIILRGVPQDV